MKIKLLATSVVVLLLLSGMGIFIAPSSGEEISSEQPWFIGDFRYFQGYMANLTAANVGNLNLSQVLEFTGTDINTTPPTVMGPWNVTWNGTTMEFDAEVDMHLVNYGAGWDIHIFDRYGWNETSQGLLNIPMPANFTKSVPTPYIIPNGTLEFTPGVFGNIILTVYNGSSGAPLEGVGFSFDKHYPFNTVTSGLRTDASGYVEFRDMQVGLEGTSNHFKMGFEMPHFNTLDGSGYTRDFILTEGATNNYNITLIEDPLVSASSPADGSDTVRTNKSQVNIFVRFHEAMNESSIDTNSVYLEEVGVGPVAVDYNWDVSSKNVNLVPNQDLKYDTSYQLVVTPRVLDDGDMEPLWRTHSSTFTTWMKPALVSGTVLINGTTDPAPDGTTIKMDNLPVELVDGEFSMEVREDFDHSITVWGPTVGDIDEYLYYGDRSVPYSFNIPRGAEFEVTTLVVEKRETRSVILTVEDEDKNILEGVTVINFITDEILMTDDQGQVQFDDIRKDITTPFKATYQNFFDYSFSVYAGEDELTLKTITLLEEALPVEVIAAGEVYIPLDENTPFQVDSYIRLDFDFDMESETMSNDNIKIIDEESSEVPIDIINDTGSYKRWRVIPRSDLSYNAGYTLTVSDQVAELGGSVNPLWKDLVINFNTEKLDSAAVNGRILVSDKGVEGVLVKVMDGDTLLGQGMSELNGYYLIDILMSELEIFPVTIIANGSEIGLTTMSLTMRTLRSGFAINDTNFDLERSPEWFTILYPKDEMGYMPVNGAITIRFQSELERTDLASFLENFTLGSPSVPTDVTISEDGKSVTIKAKEDLEHDSSYILYVSNFQEGEFHRELLTITGSKALIRGESVEILTELKPIEVILQNPSQVDIDEDNVSISADVYLYFTNYTVVKSEIEDNLMIRAIIGGKIVGNLTFSWATTGRSVGVAHDDFEGSTEYEMLIPVGIYGDNGARIREGFLVHFTTHTVTRPGYYTIENIPTDAQEPGLISVMATNTLGLSVRVVITAIPALELDKTPVVVSTFVLGPLEEKQIELDFNGFEYGEYKLVITQKDNAKDSLINDYEKNIVIGDANDPNGTTSNWLIILIIIIVLVIIIGIGLFIYMQSRKKDIEDELQEEFECPECNSLVGSDDSVCPHCGAEFEEEAYKCPKCSNMLDPDDDECTECGYDFADQDKMELEDDDDEDDEDISDMFEEDDEEDSKMELEDDDEEEEDEFEEMDEEEEEEED